MYKRDFDNLIRSGNLPSSILLYGDDYSTQTYANFLVKKMGDKESLLKQYYDEYDYGLAKSYLSQPSLFGDINLLHLKSDKKIAKKELDTLVEYCSKNQNSFFIFEFCGEDRIGKEIAKSFAKKKSADFVRFFKPNQSEAISILAKKASKISLNIDSYALTQLYFTQSEDLLLALSELDKLLLLDKDIVSNDIDAHVFGMGEVNIESFIESFLKKDDIRDRLHHILIDEGIDEIRLITAFASYINTLLLFRIYITLHGTYDVVEILGYPLPANLAKTRASQSSKITLDTYQKLLTALIDAENTLKTSTNLDKNSFIISTLIKLQTYL